MDFTVVLFNVLITLLYLLPGFLLGKSKKVSVSHLSSMSAVLLYVGTPCLLLSSFLNFERSGENLRNMGIFFLATFLLQSLFLLAVYLLLHKKFDDAKYRILSVASIMGNVGFFGLPVIRALLPDHPEVLCYSAVYTVSMNIFSFTVGIFALTRDKKYISLRAAFLNPSVLGFAVAFPLYLLGAGKVLPALLLNSIRTVSDMTTPLCMIILGIRLSSMSAKKLFCRPFVYLICACKLLLFPLFCFGMISLFPVAPSLRASLLILSATPCASILFNLSEMYHSEEELSADCVMISTLVCFLTIPLLTLLL